MSQESVLNTVNTLFLTMASERELRERLAKTGRQLHSEGLASGTSGNISARLPERDLCLIKPSGHSLAELDPKDFLVVNIKSRKVVKGLGKPSIETPFHTSLYNNREDTGSVVHVHAHYATVLSLFEVQIKTITTDICESPSLSKGISYADFAQPGSEELAQNLVKALQSCDAAIMPRHGITTVGESPESASLKAIVLERMAKIQYHAMLIGELGKNPEKLVEQVKKLKNNKL